MGNAIDAEDLRLVVTRARAHDPDAWEALYRHSRPRLLAYARRRLPTQQAAEDAVSEAFMRAIQRIDDFTWRGAGFDAWMYGIARNVVLEAHRANGRTRRLHLRFVGTNGGGDADGPDSGAEIDTAEEHALVRRAFDRLDERDRELLELRVMGGLSADEVGHVLDRTPGAVRMAQSRALQRLRVTMEELDDA